MKGMIFAAGLGTRLRPVTDTIPKALVPVGGVPMLGRIIRKLRDAGISEITVNACHFREKVVNYLKDNDFGIETKVSLEDMDVPLETGGGIKHAAPLLGRGRFLVHNVDMLSDIDLGKFMEQDSPDSLATLLLIDAEADRYLLFDDSMRLVGWTNVRTGEVKSPFPDFDPAAYRKYSFCGIHIISDEVFGLMEDWPDRFSIIDFYLQACATHKICGVIADNPMIIDIGSPEKLALANERISDFQ